jgi:hypothetical protein
VDGVPVAIDRRTRAFLRVLRGVVPPRRLPVEVVRLDGARRVLTG